MEGLPAGGAAARRPTSRWRRKPARDAAHGLRSGALALASALCAGRCLLAGAPAAPAGRGRPSGSRGVLRLAAEGEAEFKPVVFDDSYDSYANRDERLRIPDYAVWILPRKKAAQQLLAWAEEEGVTEEQSDYLRDLAEKEVIVQIDAVDQDQNFIEFIAFSPAQLGPTPKELFQGWIESFAPKRQVIRRPEQLSLWELEVKGDRGSMAQISKGV
ncbi:unnamed protein product [Prorocentrum cordatum]|uniref:Uncharacterized protein n=1 Tax=Prorocentrum cordatum TaxID=2364126 RepID=A0ABN9T540_9DINO|nr:unnamed protein product [Polarella glacialis]